MDAVSSIALATGLGWASGIRLYATVCIVGLLERLGYIGLPAALEVLSNPYVIGLSGALFVVEFFADKFPVVDSAWDSVHTFIRIPAGALLAMGAIDSSDPLVAAAFALLGGTLAGGTHFAKSGSRALINTSPEPFSNWVASFGEEGLLVMGLWLALAHPAWFLVFIVLFVAVLVWVLPRLWRGVRLVWRRIAGTSA
ncbi:MAG: DUF4126 domain-containing protein [Nitrosomonadales bacterium]|nr:DUF4126 domain-containing protein [Nitrosomonadales bacterium]